MNRHNKVGFINMDFGKVTVDIFCDDAYSLVGIKELISQVYLLYKNTRTQEGYFSCAIYADTKKSISLNRLDDVDFSQYDCTLFILPESKMGMYNSYISKYNHAVIKSSSSLDVMTFFFYSILFDQGREFCSMSYLNVDAHQLSAREKTTIKLLVLGHDYTCIAEALGIKEKTVSCYYRSAIRKIGIKSFSELMCFATITPNVLFDNVEKNSDFIVNNAFHFG